MIETPADHGEDLHTRINQVRVMVQLLATNDAFTNLDKSDLAYALEAIWNQLGDACNLSGMLVEEVTKMRA